MEQALEETKELIRQLESKIRNQSLIPDTSLHTLEPASMIRQVSQCSKILHMYVRIDACLCTYVRMYCHACHK